MLLPSDRFRPMVSVWPALPVVVSRIAFARVSFPFRSAWVKDVIETLFFWRDPRVGPLVTVYVRLAAGVSASVAVSNEPLSATLWPGLITTVRFNVTAGG